MNTVTYTLGNTDFTLLQLLSVVMMIVGAVATWYILGKTFEKLFFHLQRRWDNRSTLQRKLSRWDCVRPR